MDKDIGKKLPREDTVVIAFEKKEETESAIKYLEDHGYRPVSFAEYLSYTAFF